MAAGVRRIEAVSGKAAEDFINSTFLDITSIRGLFNNPKELLKHIENSVAENKELKKKIDSLEAKQLAIYKSDLFTKAETINGVAFIGAVLDISSPDNLKKLANELVTAIDGLVILTANINGKAAVAIGIADTLVAKGFEAPKLIKDHITAIIKGGGGGQKNLATAGGQDASNLDKVIEAVKGLL